MERHLVQAEIDLGAIAHNVGELRRITDAKARLLVAVKANGYGHGAVETAQTALASGADQLGVARLEEALSLRRAGIGAPILIFGFTPPEKAVLMVEKALTPAVSSLEHARELARALDAADAKLAIHLKVDTGMGRMGMQATTQRVDDVLAMAALPHLKLSGILSHFAAADSRDKTHAREQFRCFHDFLARLDQAGLEIPLQHMANSGAIIDMPETHLDMVRAGISVYGLYPSDEVDKTRIALRPAMRITARIAHLKKVPTGFKVSYGSTWHSKSPTTIATIPIGYADGYSRLLSNRGSMLVRGMRAPIVGRVCMDLTMLDVGHIPGVVAGDEVVVLGDQGDEKITADEIADLLGTINYEVVSALTARIPRVYRK